MHVHRSDGKLSTSYNLRRDSFHNTELLYEAPDIFESLKLFSFLAITLSAILELESDSSIDISKDSTDEPIGFGMGSTLPVSRIQKG